MYNQREDSLLNTAGTSPAMETCTVDVGATDETTPHYPYTIFKKPYCLPAAVQKAHEDSPAMPPAAPPAKAPAESSATQLASSPPLTPHPEPQATTRAMRTCIADVHRTLSEQHAAFVQSQNACLPEVEQAIARSMQTDYNDYVLELKHFKQIEKGAYNQLKAARQVDAEETDAIQAALAQVQAAMQRRSVAHQQVVSAERAYSTAQQDAAIGKALARKKLVERDDLVQQIQELIVERSRLRLSHISERVVSQLQDSVQTFHESEMQTLRGASAVEARSTCPVRSTTLAV